MDGLSRRGGRGLLLLLIGVAIGLSGCSPEGARTRGGGAGADPRNQEGDIELTGDGERADGIYHDTPVQVPGAEDGARDEEDDEG